MSSLSWDIAVGVAFAVGVLLFGISAAMLRSARKASEPAAPAPLQWPLLVDDELRDADATLRADLVARLAVVDSAWSRDVLQRAREEERDPQVAAAIAGALTASCESIEP